MKSMSADFCYILNIVCTRRRGVKQRAEVHSQLKSKTVKINFIDRRLQSALLSCFITKINLFIALKSLFSYQLFNTNNCNVSSHDDLHPIIKYALLLILLNHVFLQFSLKKFFCIFVSIFFV